MESTSNAAARSTSRSLDGVPPVSSDSIMMWGAKGSGKSIYIASLVYWAVGFGLGFFHGEERQLHAGRREEHHRGLFEPTR